MNRIALCPLLLAPVLACGDGPADPDDPANRLLRASLTIEPAVVMPGQTAFVTASASVSDSARLERAHLRVEGLGGDTTLALPVSGRGSQTWDLFVSFPNGPFEGELAFRLIAQWRSEADTATATLRVQDDGPPRIRLRVANVVEPPDTLAIMVEAEDAAGLTDLTLRVRGAMTRDTTRSFDYRSLADLSLHLPFGRSIPLGDSVVVTVEAYDGFAKKTTSTQLVRVADTTYPFVRASVDTIQQDTPIDMSHFRLLFFPGDSVRIHLEAVDNHSLTWLGYQYPYLGFGDSIPLDSTEGSARFSFQLPPGTNSDQPIMYFAWDASGHRFSTWIFLAVMDGAFRTIEELDPHPNPMSSIPQQSTYVLDEQRDVLYYTAYPSTALYALQLNPLASLPPVDFGRGVRGLSSSPGGDTLWVLLIGRPNLLVGWEAAQGPTVTDTIPLPELGQCDGWNLQVAEGARALVTGSPTGCPTVEVNLRDKSRRLRNIPADLRNLAASADRRTIVAWSPSDAMVYHAELDYLGPRRVLYPGFIYDHLGYQEPAFDRAGTNVLVRNRLYDRELTAYRSLLPDPHLPDPQALSWDGGTAFIGEWPGYWRLDVESGAVIDRVILPRIAWRLIPHPDGQRLIVFGGGWAGVVDLR